MSLNLKAALRAPFWKRLGEASNTVPGPQDQAYDNNYAEYIFTSSGSAIPAFIPLNSSNQVEISGGHTVVDGSLTLNAVAVPATPTIANVGTAGVTTYTYAVVAMSGNLAAPSATASTTTGNASLSGANYNTITFKPIVGANSYIVYRTVGGSTQGIIAVIVGGYRTNSTTAETIVVLDQALIADGSTAPTTNITGAVIGDWDVYGNVNVNALTTPATPVAVVNGTAGATTNAYKIVARCGSPASPTGHTAASSALSVTTCAATLTATNSVTLKWQPVAGAIGYDVYRTTSGGTPSTTGKINATLVLSAQGGFTDTGLAGDSGSAPTTNTTGILNGSTSGDTAQLTQINDTNGNPGITFTATTSAVNGITVANSATGNAPSITAGGTAGSDSNISLTINPKGTGTLSLGTLTTGTTLTLAGAVTANGNTDIVNIATGNTAGTGAKTVHIADGTPAGTGVQAVTIGCNASAAAHTTTIQGGNSTAAIALTPTGAGTIVIGAAGGTGAITVGSSSGSQSVLIGNGAGVATVQIANGGTAGNTVTIAGDATAGTASDTVQIATGSAASTAKKIVSIATGTPNTSGNNQVTIGGGTTTLATANAVVTSYQAWNFQGTEGGSNNAITANLVDASGNNITLAAGLEIKLKLAHSLQAGANTFALNGGSTKSIKKSTNPANDLGTAYVSGSIVNMIYDGTVWQVYGQ